MTGSVNILRCYSPRELQERIDWSYFFFAWGLRGESSEADALRKEAERLLPRFQAEGVVARAVYSLRPAWSEGDDVVLPAYQGQPEVRLCFLRQQHLREDSPCLCLSDFIAPHDAVAAPLSAQYLGLFSTAAASPEEFPHDVTSIFHRADACPCCNPALRVLGRGRLEKSVADDDAYSRMMRQTVLDRLAEAAAEMLHEELLGSFGTERVGTEVRPAVGYPSMPDQSLIFDIAKALSIDSIGVRLTENGMMIPHAATCGLVFAHPAARYFDVGFVSPEQIADYASRRQRSIGSLQRFLVSRKRC